MSAWSGEIGANPSWPIETTRRMNRMYRRQRHIYDGSRRYYLLGRDRMIRELRLEPGSSVLEIGCGTGRNLVLAAWLHRDARFFGVDVSTEMLTTAISAISRTGLGGRIRVAHGDAATFDPRRTFGIAGFDRVMISYCLSMIPDWREVLRLAATCLKPAGRLHVVDFGRQERLPALARVLLRRWLAMFEVMPRDDLEHELSVLAQTGGATLSFERPFRDYAQYGVVTFPPEPSKP